MCKQSPPRYKLAKEKNMRGKLSTGPRWDANGFLKSNQDCRPLPHDMHGMQERPGTNHLPNRTHPCNSRTGSLGCASIGLPQSHHSHSRLPRPRVGPLTRPSAQGNEEATRSMPHLLYIVFTSFKNQQRCMNTETSKKHTTMKHTTF